MPFFRVVSCLERKPGRKTTQNVSDGFIYTLEKEDRALTRVAHWGRPDDLFKNNPSLSLVKPGFVELIIDRATVNPDQPHTIDEYLCSMTSVRQKMWGAFSCDTVDKEIIDALRLYQAKRMLDEENETALRSEENGNANFAKQFLKHLNAPGIDTQIDPVTPKTIRAEDVKVAAYFI